MRQPTVFALTSLTTAALLLPAVGASAEHEFALGHWGRTSAGALDLTVVDDLDAAWSPVLRTHAPDVWDDSGVVNLTIQAGVPDPDCALTSGVVVACNADYGDNGWVGIARTSTRKGHLTAATVAFNDHYVDGPTYDGSSSDGVPLRERKRRALVCHEIGHVLGLGHQDVDFDNPATDTCLDYARAADLWAGMETPNAHDFDALATQYTHADRRATVRETDGGDGGGGGGNGNGKGRKGKDRAAEARQVPAGWERAAWGREVERAPDGSHSVFVREVGDELLHTIVTWA